MKSNSGSFSAKLFCASLAVGISFIIVSIFINNYIIRKVISNIFLHRFKLFINYSTKLIENGGNISELYPKIEMFFHKNELHRMTLFSEDGKIIYEIKGEAKFNKKKNFTDINKLINTHDSYFIEEGKYLSYVKKTTYKDTNRDTKNGFLLFEINLNSTLEAVGPIYKYRIPFTILIITLLLLFVSFTTKLLTEPLARLQREIENVAQGKSSKIDMDKIKYTEFAAIINNFNRLTGSLKETKEDLTMSEERLKTLLEKSSDIILVLDSNFRIEYASSTFKELTGIDIDKAERKIPLSEFVLKEDRGRLLPIYRRILRGKTVNDFELKITDKNKDDKFLLTSWILRETKEGNNVGIILFGKDITEHKKIEDILRKRTEALETILFSLSHDLKGPIFTLKGMTLLFQKKYYESLDEQGKHFVDRIGENIIRMERLISNMLDISRFQRQIYKTENVNLYNLMQTIMTDMSEYIREYNAKILLEDRLPVIRGDKEKLYIAFKNLFENSFKYRSPSRELNIIIKSIIKPEGVEIVFEDNGIGIENKYLEKLFKPFSRAISQVDKNPQGHGIGLAIVKGILDAHNAQIKVESAYGEWTRFRIFFDKSLLEGFSSNP
ncbi:MAG: PAS domain-containing sensor histidine kinase [Deltaproteobacteria bacterium]|nr:PAS domain-containing sensor histidine kinase [Deltaproteobacteria bacterium]